jgi:hypothetical protein
MTSTARAASSRSKSARSLASTTEDAAGDGVEMDDARCTRASVPRATHAMATHAMAVIFNARECVGRADAAGAREVSPARIPDAGEADTDALGGKRRVSS